jgi:hypothetical protein
MAAGVPRIIWPCKQALQLRGKHSCALLWLLPWILSLMHIHNTGGALQPTHGNQPEYKCQPLMMPSSSAGPAAALLLLFQLALLQFAVDGDLQPLQVPAGLPAGHPLASIIPTTNAAVAAWAAHSGQKASWLQLPWLTVECYLYVRLAAIIAGQVSSAFKLLSVVVVWQYNCRLQLPWLTVE